MTPEPPGRREAGPRSENDVPTRGVWNFERLKLHVSEIDFPRASDLLIEAAVAQVAVSALDRAVMDAFLDRAIDRTRLAGAAPIPVRRPRF